MWLAWERARLAVFADELLTRGDRLGERIASSLAAEDCDDHDRRIELLARATELDAVARDPRVDELLEILRLDDVRREYGVVVALEVPPNTRYYDESTQLALYELLGHRELQFVQVLQFPRHWFHGSSRRLARLDRLLGERFVQLRPRIVRVVGSFDERHQIRSGAPHSNYLTGAQPSSRLAHLLLSAQRGLIGFIEADAALSLSRLAISDDRLRAETLAARLVADPFSPVSFTWFARAFWDDTPAVRDVAWAHHDRYRLAMSAVIPDLLQLEIGSSLDRTRELLRQLSERPEIVVATAPALDLRIASHRSWLAHSAHPQAAARARRSTDLLDVE